MSKAFTVVSYPDNPDDFLGMLDQLAAVESNITAEQFVMEDRYQQAIEQDNYSNLSFCLEKAGKVQAGVLVHRLGDVVRYNHLGVSVTGVDENKKVVAAVFETLIAVAKQHKAKTVLVDDRTSGEVLSMIGAEAFNYKGTPNTKLEAVLDITMSEEEIHSSIRKSYKSLVNQGRREMTFEYVTSDNADKEKFESFREFHKEVAGRVTRPIESWDAQFEMIEKGQAELVLGYLEPHGLVSSALFNDVGDMTVYSVAVYNRDLFDYPLAHANVYEGICRAKARGQKSFYLGQIAPYGSVDEKEFNIGKFKKGFCDRLNSYIEWSIPVE